MISGLHPISISIIASGRLYQRLGAMSATSYAINAGEGCSITMYLPHSESPTDDVIRLSERFHFNICTFPFQKVSDQKFTAQLKCQGFANIISNSDSDSIVLFVDADTICFRHLEFTDQIIKDVLAGHLGIANDIADRHTNDSSLPWYLPQSVRREYVNSGVILASKATCNFFLKCRELSERQEFLRGPFNDQKIINYVLGMYSQGVTTLEPRFNQFWPALLARETVIGHLACGAEEFVHSRIAMQVKLLRVILESHGLEYEPNSGLI